MTERASARPSQNGIELKRTLVCCSDGSSSHARTHPPSSLALPCTRMSAKSQAPMVFKRRLSAAGRADKNDRSAAPAAAVPPAKKKQQQASLAAFGFGGGGGGGSTSPPPPPPLASAGGGGVGGPEMEVEAGEERVAAGGTTLPTTTQPQPPHAIDPDTGLPLARNPASHARWQAKLARSGDLDRRRRGSADGEAAAAAAAAGGGAGPSTSTLPKLTPLETQVTALQAANPGTVLAIEGVRG